MINDSIVVQRRSLQIKEFNARLQVLFGRLPMLCGFHVGQDLSSLVEVTIYGSRGASAPSELVDEIGSSLEDLVVDLSDDAVELLRGKTFARAIH
jgi:hypothetical protein